MNNTRSPLRWIGGKFYSARHIIDAFPAPHTYDTYVEPCGGAAHVLFAKTKNNHREIYNDINEELVNFWMQCRDHAEELEARVQSLPYARSLYYAYHKSLFDGTTMTDMERAARWYYVLRNTTTGSIRKSASGWNNTNDNIIAYRSVSQTLHSVQQRFLHVLIENRDIGRIIEIYDSPRTLFYIDPPYIGTEHYYSTGTFDHEGLANALNNAKGMVALSYYPHPHLDEWYPAPKWRRITWQTYKHAEKTTTARQTATEMLLMNYPSPLSLWEE